MKKDQGEKDFPRYLMMIAERRVFLSFRQAVVAYNAGQVPCDFGELVLHEDFTVTDMTHEDMSRISSLADEYSGNK